MSCTFDKERLTGYFDGELEAAEKGEVEKHISACSECLRELGEIKSAAQLVKILPRLKAPASVAQAVAREVAPPAQLHSLARYRKSIGWTFAAAAALLVVANVAYFSRNMDAPEGGGAPVAGGPALIAPHPVAEEAKNALREKDGARDEDKRRSPGLDRNPQPFAEGEKRAMEKGATFGARPETAEPTDKAKAGPVEQAQNRGLAQEGAAKPADAKAKPAAAPAPESGRNAEPLAKKDAAGAPPGAAAAPPAPSKAAAPKPEPAPLPRRQGLEMQKQLGDAPAKDAEAQQLRQRADGAPPPQQVAVGTAQPAATRAKAQAILAKLGVTAERRAEKADAQESGPLAVEMTASQFAELKRQLEAEGGVQLLAVAAGDDANGQAYRANAQGQGPAGKMPSAGIGGGAGAKSEADGKLAAAQGDPKKPAVARVEEERKSADSLARSKEAKEPEAALTGQLKKTQAEPLQKFVLIFQAPAAEKK